MDKAIGEKETQDFMNVESFSQLPFIRRATSKDKNPKPIRLFGKDFTGGDFSGTTGQEDYSDSSETKTKQEEEEEEESQSEDNINDNSITNNRRRFECHYCFRNFPTSQALGGHQNAHKRERQLTKRGSSSSFHHLDSNGYHRYPSWSNGPWRKATKSYGEHSSGPLLSAYSTRQIRGNRPFPSGVQGVYNSNAAFTCHDSSNSTLTLMSRSQPQPPLQVGGSATQNRMSSHRYGLNPNVQDHVSLDLHL